MERIVLASAEDVKQVGSMYDAINDYFDKHENYCYPNWQKGKYPVLEDAKRAMKNQTLYVLKTEEGIAGAIIIDHTQHSEYKKISWTQQVPDESVMTMHTVVVAPDYRGRGFGEKLVRFGIDLCKNSGAKTIRLDTHYKNVPARRLQIESIFLWPDETQPEAPHSTYIVPRYEGWWTRKVPICQNHPTKKKSHSKPRWR